MHHGIQASGRVGEHVEEHSVEYQFDPGLADDRSTDSHQSHNRAGRSFVPHAAAQVRRLAANIPNHVSCTRWLFVVGNLLWLVVETQVEGSSGS